MTAKTVAQILEDAAEIIETRGKCVIDMYSPRVDKFCAIGAIARATYSEQVVPNSEIEHIAWIRPFNLRSHSLEDQHKYDPRFTKALALAANEARNRYERSATTVDDHSSVYMYNDQDENTAQDVGDLLRTAARAAREELATA